MQPHNTRLGRGGLSRGWRGGGDHLAHSARFTMKLAVSAQQL